MKETKEIWKDIPNYEGLYQVSNLGRVKSLNRVRHYWNGKGNMKRVFNEKILNPQKRNSYLTVSISDENHKIKIKSIHRLVCETFIPNPENKPQVNHINGVKTDNKVENLEWVTQSENSLHASKNRLGYSGSLNGQSKLTKKDVLEILKIREKGFFYKDIAVSFNVSCSTIGKICRNISYKYER